MKKAISKSEREHILLELVSHACTKAACMIVEEMAVLRRGVHQQLLGNWQANLPNVKRADQMTLLQEAGAYAVTFQPTVYSVDAEGRTKSVGEFCKVSWRNDGMADSKKQRLSAMASKILKLVPGASNVVTDGVSTSWGSNFYAPATFADIIRGFQPTGIYREGKMPEGKGNVGFNNVMVQYHDLYVVELNKLKDLLFSAEDMYHDLGAVIAPLKNAHALAEAMPEAVKHFPPSLTYVKPTKEIADPAAINQIRAKLAKGLPI